MTQAQRDRNWIVDAILTHIRNRVNILAAEDRYETLHLLAERLPELNDDDTAELPAVNVEGTTDAG